MIETSADHLADMLFHREFIINVDSKVSDNMHRIDDVTANHECGFSTMQLMKTLPCTNPHELSLRHIELQPTRCAPADHISDAVAETPQSDRDFSD